MPLFLLTYWKQIGAVAIMIGALTFSYFKGAESVQAKWDLEVAKANIAARQAERNATIISNDIGIKHETNIKVIDSNYAAALDGVRKSYDNHLPNDKPTACKPYVESRADRIYKANERLRIAREAELNTLKLIDLQEWVRSVCVSK